MARRRRRRNLKARNGSMNEGGFYFQYAKKGMGEAGFYFAPVEGMDEAEFSFPPVEDSARLAVNLEQSMDHDGHPLGVVWEGEAAVANGVSVWNVPGNGAENESGYRGKVILVKLGECRRRIGIDGSPEAIRDVIKSVFGVRTRRPFWLEDEHGVVRAFGGDMPLKTYTLHLDEGVPAKICISTSPNHMPCCIVEKTFYSEDDFSSFLLSRGWIGVKGLRGNRNRNVDSVDDLKSDEVYHGIRMVTNNSN